jgi:hypothetical protein
MGVARASSAKMGRENEMKNSVCALSILMITVVISPAALAQINHSDHAALSAPEVSQAAMQTYPFSGFRAKVETESSELELRAFFRLGPQSKGINPLNEDISLKIGSFSATIPANSFKATLLGWFKYEGIINGTDLEVRTIPLGSNRYVFRAEAEGKGLEQPVPGPVKVEVSIGNDSGSATVKVERGWI